MGTRSNSGNSWDEGSKKNEMTWMRPLFWTALWWLWMPALYLVFYGFISLLMPGWTINRTLDQFMMANFWSLSTFAWWWLAVGFIGTIVIWLWSQEASDRAKTVSGLLCAALIVVSVVQIYRTTWNNSKDFARYYNKSTVFYTPDLDHYPDSLTRLFKGATVGDGTRCDRNGGADVPSCIKQGDLAATGWDPRVGSLDGAIIAIKRRSGDVQKVSLSTDTLVYLNAWKDQPARWSGVLDGNGINQSLGGVSEWSGEGEPTQCLFKGDYAIDRAFGGGRSRSMGHLLADKFPAFQWKLSDVWGYCEGQQPVVIVPVTRQSYFKNRTVDTAAGIIIVRGDHGKTKLEYKPVAKAGDYPGPVYPASLVAVQRSQAAWAAGRENEDRNGFGYEPATSEAQAGNVSEYLLRNSATGRLEWVTPLTLRHSSSELFVAYAVSPADEVSSGSLNQLSIYVLADNDPRRVNIDTLDADARNYFATNAGTFISNGGKLVEFTPINGIKWRGFGELNGQVIYRLDISADKSVAPTLVSLNGQPASQTSDNAVCGKPVAQLSPSDLTNCLKLFADELAQKQANQGNSSG